MTTTAYTTPARPMPVLAKYADLFSDGVVALPGKVAAAVPHTYGFGARGANRTWKPAAQDKPRTAYFPVDRVR